MSIRPGMKTCGILLILTITGVIVSNGINAAETPRCYVSIRSFYDATVDDDVERARCLIRNGADINAKNPIGETYLHTAARASAENVMALLLERGADPNVRTKQVGDKDDRKLEDVTPLHLVGLSDRGGNEQVAKLLLEHGAKIDARSEKGITPLHVAAREGHFQVTRLLVNSGAKIDARSEKGMTPLHGAAREGHFREARLLVNNGAEIDARTIDKPTDLPYDHATSLHYAAGVAEASSIVTLLLNNGAQPNAKTRGGVKAARVSSDHEISEILHRAIVEEKESVTADDLEGWVRVGTEKCLGAPNCPHGGGKLYCTTDDNMDIDTNPQIADTSVPCRWETGVMEPSILIPERYAE